MKRLALIILSISVLLLPNNLAAETLYFPHIASNATWETEICLINTSPTQNLTGTLITFNNFGQQINSTSLSLGPGARQEIVVGADLLKPDKIGYILFESSSTTISGYTKFYINSKFRVAIPATSKINNSDILIPHIASNAKWWTGISLLNTTASAKELIIEFSDGTVKNRTIAAKEHQAFAIKQLFGNAPQPQIQSAVIKNGAGLVGLELFGSNDGYDENYLSGVLLKIDTTGSIYYPHIASDANWWTGIVAYNPSPQTCNLTITPYQKDGTVLATQNLPISGKQKYIGSAKGLNLPEGSAWFKIDADHPITGLELFATYSGNQLGGYTSVGISCSDGIFPKIEKDGWTGIAFVNIEGKRSTVTITAHDNSGTTIALRTISLAPYEKIVSTVEALFYSNISSATYLKYSSTSKIVGFQINGSNGGMMLDALPADSFAANTAQFITSKTIDSQGGILAADDFSLTIPAGVFTDSVDLKLYKMSTNNDFDQGLCTDTFRVTGLPDEFPETLLPDLKPSGTLTDESFIMVGEELLISSQLAPGMAYHLFPATPNSGFLSSRPRAAVPVQFRSSTPTSNRFLDFLGITGWKTYTTENGQGHFAIRYPDASVNLSQVTTLGQYLEAAYDTYDNMGFSYEGRTSWPIAVTVTNLTFGTYGLFCKSLWGNNSATLQFNQNSLDNLSELRTTAGHEFFHFIQYLYDSRNNYSRGHDNSFSISLHWLDEATAVWAEEKFTNTQNYVSSIRARCEMAPFDGMEAGTGGNIVQAGEHGYGMSAFIKYLVAQYGESIVRDIYLKILEQKHPIQAINQSLNINNNLFMIWEPFLREYVTGNIYNVPKGEFLLYRSGSFLLKSDTDRTKSFTDSYPDLSAKLYMIRLNFPDISPAQAINFTIDQDLCDITLFKFRDADAKIQYLSHSATKTLRQKDLRSLTDDGYHLLVMVSNANYFSPYTNTKPIKLDILVESIAAAMTLSASPNTLDADGTSTSTITATVTDDVGDPVEGETVTFSTNSGSLSAASADTNASGIASVNYTAPGSAPPGGTSTITATTTNVITETVVITVNAGPSWAGWPNPQWCPQNGTGAYQYGGTFIIYPPGNPSQAIQCTYHGNSQLEWEIPFLTGEKDGWRKSYFESGALKSEIPYKAGKKEGTGTWFYEGGSISSQAPYLNDLMEGNVVSFYENGQTMAVIPHHLDLRNGMAHWFYDTGERERDEPWQNDLEQGIEKGFYKSGLLKYEHPYTDGNKNGTAKGYYENGNRKYETPYTNDKKNGISKEFWENTGQLKSETPYSNDVINGTQFKYVATGELSEETSYIDGVRNGIQKYYHSNGQVAHSISWYDNSKNGWEKWYSEAGELTRCEKYENGTFVGSCMP